MSALEAGEADRTTMSPLDEVVSPTSVKSELMITDMLDEHETALHEHRDSKRKRDTDGDELTPRKLPSLTRNNNDVRFVLEESADDDLHEDRDDVSLTSLFYGRVTRNVAFINTLNAAAFFNVFSSLSFIRVILCRNKEISKFSDALIV